MDIYAMAERSVEASIWFGALAAVVVVVVSLGLAVAGAVCVKTAPNSYADRTFFGGMALLVAVVGLVLAVVIGMSAVNTAMQREWNVQQRVLDADPDFNLRNR